VFLSPQPARAIPVFAYIYGKPCGTCHTVYPQLNPVGELFSARGMRGPTPVIEPIPLGDHFALPGTIPVAISAGIGEDLSGTPSVDSFREHFNLEFLSILAGSELGPHLSFLADYAPLIGSPTTGETRDNHRMGLAFLQAHAEPFGWLGNAKAGIQELPLGASPRVHRLSVTPYLVYQVTPASLLAAPAPVSGPRKETTVLGATQYALDLSIVEPDEGPAFWLGASFGSNNKDDFNSSKDVYLRLQQGFLDHKAGFFLYYSPDAVGPDVTDEALRFGPDFTLYGRRGRIVAQFLAAWDSNPTGFDVDFWSYGGFLELNYRLTPSLIALGRVDAVGAPRFDDTGRGGQVDYEPGLWDVVGGLQYLLDENLKVLVEATYGETSVQRVTDASGAVKRVGRENWLVTFQLRAAFFPLRPPFYSWFVREAGS
jgi:hypothetical protein